MADNNDKPEQPEQPEQPEGPRNRKEKRAQKKEQVKQKQTAQRQRQIRTKRLVQQGAAPADVTSPESDQELQEKAEALLEELKLNIADDKTGLSIKFPYPLYGVTWIGDGKLLVGGGGGKKYGMGNQVICAQVKARGAKVRKFRPLMHHDFKDRIVWSMSGLHVENKESNKLLVGHGESISSMELDLKKSNIRRLSYLNVENNDMTGGRKHCAISPAGSMGVVAQDNSTILPFRLKKSGEMVPRGDVIKAHSDRICDLSIAACPEDLGSKEVALFDVNKAKNATHMLVASCSDDRTLKVSKIWTQAPKDTELDEDYVEELCSVNSTELRGRKCVFRCAKLHANGRFVYAVSTGMDCPSTVHKFEIQAKGKKWTLVEQTKAKVTEDAVTAFSFSSCGQYVCCGDNEGNAYVLDSRKLSKRATFKALHDCPITAIDMDKDGFLASTDIDCILKLAKFDKSSSILPPTWVIMLIIALLIGLFLWSKISAFDES